jgi:transcriptional regulator with GAF, ATPase, and Fis domain
MKVAEVEQATATVMARLARDLCEVDGLNELLERVVRSAVVSVPGAEHAGISFMNAKGRFVPRVQTNDLIRIIDEIQTELREGPCMAVMKGPVGVVRIDDVASDGRWPRFARATLEHGACSAMSFRLYVGNKTTGSLSVFSSKAHAFDTEGEAIGELFATHAAIAMRGAEQTETLSEALRSRDVIGQAKGLLIERLKITEQEAFAILVEVSQRQNRKLRAIADEIMFSGQLPQ